MHWYYVCGISGLIFWVGFSIFAYFTQNDSDLIIPWLSLPMILFIVLVVAFAFVIFLSLLPFWLIGKGVKKLFHLDKENKKKEARFEEIFGKPPTEIRRGDVYNRLTEMSLKCDCGGDLERAYNEAYDLAVVFDFVRRYYD